MEKRNRMLAILFIGAGVLLIFGRWLGFLSIVALLLLLAGVYRTTNGDVKKGYRLLGAGAILLVLDHLVLVLGVVLLSLGLFIVRSRRLMQGRRHVQKQNFSSGFDWDRHPWMMGNLSAWHVLGQTDIDLSLAMAEERETVMLFQGIFGDTDLHLAEGYGIEIEAFVLFGSIDLGTQRDTGMMNRLNWKSANYDTSEYRVKICISYLMGDLDITLP
ncbi:hypothetical protein F4V43_00630 [Paenibacillus spiritus]|uniref:Cell wall-active antibiotics response LiaF-like C-terminal domain-containing protein n=1 Tax=Paenibacillus spiritus TaxID=2496557 RepID=A0A5J5GKV5_9BACL|nr:cell wall-active antibiotics response protein LiaF [Paenibacillus spiritus]KAA9008667.1 hypothetical protein F4V43_00630 [Paenibacillus spiritus]